MPAAVTRDLVRWLLRNGARFPEPAPDILKTASWLEGLGAIETRRLRTVRCANPLDQDFPPSDRDCRGLVELYAGADEGSGDYRCPDCDRVLYPEADDKQIVDTLSVVVSRSGIEALLLTRLGEAAAGARFTAGVLHVSVGHRAGAIILAEYCTDGYWLSVTTVRLQPWLYITLSSDAAWRMAADPAIAHLELADILLDDLDLPAILAARSTAPPQVAAVLDMPVYALGARPSSPAATSSDAPRRFMLRLSPEGVAIDDLLVVPASHATAYAIMRHLVTRLASALGSVDGVGAVSVDELADELGKDLPHAIDAESIRRALNRTRKEITTTVRRLNGTPIDDNDIIEAVSRTGSLSKQQGYRLNPRTVVLVAAYA